MFNRHQLRETQVIKTCQIDTLLLFLKKNNKVQKSNYTRTCSQTFLYKEKTDLEHVCPVQRFTVWEDACLEEEDLSFQVVAASCQEEAFPSERRGRVAFPSGVPWVASCLEEVPSSLEEELLGPSVGGVRPGLGGIEWERRLYWHQQRPPQPCLDPEGS